VRNIGQLELANVMEQGRLVRRAIRTGRPVDEDVEVLSGLAEGEKVVLPASQEAKHD
jgi:hypothetical protein